MRSLHDPGYRALRKGRWSEAGRPYLVTTPTFNRNRLFADDELARIVARKTLCTDLWRGGRLHGWVLMPDHWHALLDLGGDDLSNVIRRFKSVTARAINVARGCNEPVWQEGFHDHALRKEETIVGVLRFVLANPLRAGLCRSVWSYPYWDAAIVDGSYESLLDLVER